jgi:hypothetical protein
MVQKLMQMLSSGTLTPPEVANVVLQCQDIKNAVKHLILQEIDEQCQKLCTKNPEQSSVLRVPVAKHKVD